MARRPRRVKWKWQYVRRTRPQSCACPGRPAPAGPGSPGRWRGPLAVGGPARVVELGEVGGEVLVVEPAAVEPGVEAAERAGVNAPVGVRADGGLERGGGRSFGGRWVPAGGPGRRGSVLGFRNCGRLQRPEGAAADVLSRTARPSSRPPGSSCFGGRVTSTPSPSVASAMSAQQRALASLRRIRAMKSSPAHGVEAAALKGDLGFRQSPRLRR